MTDKQLAKAMLELFKIKFQKAEILANGNRIDLVFECGKIKIRRAKNGKFYPAYFISDGVEGCLNTDIQLLQFFDDWE